MAYTWILFGHTSVGAGQTYSLGEAYPTTRGGETFGFSADLTENDRERTNEGPLELRGIVFQPNGTGSSMVQFRWNFTGSNRSFNVRLAAGDWVSEQAQRIIIRDGTGGAALATISTSTGVGGALQWVDATGAVRTGDPRAGGPGHAASWPNTNAPAALTFTADHLIVEIATAAASFSTTLAAIGIEPVPGATASGTTVSAAASLIAGSASAASGATANGVTLTAAASLLYAGGTLQFQAAGMEFGARTGLGIDTFALDAAVNYRYTVHADSLVLGSALITSGVVATDSGGKLPNLVNSLIAPGSWYRVVAIRQSDGEASPAFRMRAYA